MKLEGEIGEINVVERLVELGRETFTGAVRFENDGVIKIIYFKGGDVLSASSNDRSDSVDEILLRAGKVTREHVKQALARRKETETLGDALLGLGFITRKELTWARRVQVVGALRSIEAWKAGSYTIVADYLPKREEGTVFPLSQIIVELIVTDQDRGKFERLLDGGEAVFTQSGDFHEAFGKLGLNQDAADIATHIDGVSTASEIAAASGKDAFNVYKLLEALTVLGLLQRKEASAAPAAEIPIPPAGPDLDFASDAVQDRDQTWRIAPGVVPRLAPEVAWPPVKESPADSAPVEAADFEPPLDTEPPSVADAVAVSNWDIAPPPESGTGAAAPIEMSAAPLAQEPQWGFDEAQIEAARRADVPQWSDEPGETSDEPSMHKEVETASKPNRIIGAVIAAAVLIVVVFGGFAAWQWWQKQNAPAPELTPVARAPRHPRFPKSGATAQPPVTASTATAPSGSMTTAGGTPATGTIVPFAPAKAPAAAAPAAVATQSAPPPAAPAATSTAPASPLVAAASRTAAARSAMTQHAPAAAAPSSAARLERTATGGALITNAPGGRTAAPAAAAPASDANRAQYDQMARNFAANPSGKYTVQFELVCQAASISRALKEGGNSVWFVPTSYRGQPCYRVFWGRYAAREEAQRAMGELPAGLRGAGSAVVAVPKP